MDNVKNLLDKCKDLCQLQSDNQLAIKLKVTRASVSRWRNGLGQPDTVTCAKIAEITGLPLARVLGIVGEARAISAAEKAVWRKLAQAAMVLVAISPAIASAAETAASQIQHSFSAIVGGFLVISIMSKITGGRIGKTMTYEKAIALAIDALSSTAAAAQRQASARTATTSGLAQGRRRMFTSKSPGSPELCCYAAVCIGCTDGRSSWDTRHMS